MSNATKAGTMMATAVPAKSFAARFKAGFDFELIAFHVGVWFFVEVVLMVRHGQVKDFVAKFVDGELLFAQFFATIIYLAIYILTEVYLRSGAGSIMLNGAALKNIRLIHAELWKIPVFFGGAMFIASLMMGFEVAISLLNQGRGLFSNLALYSNSFIWFLSAIALFTLSALLNLKKI